MKIGRKFLRLAEAEQRARRILIGIVEKQPVAAQQHDSRFGKFQRREGRIILPLFGLAVDPVAGKPDRSTRFYFRQVVETESHGALEYCSGDQKPVPKL